MMQQGNRSQFLMSVMLTVLSVLLCCSQAQAESSVWKAEKSGAVIYLGGTIHLLRQSDYPLPTEFDKAYKASDLVMFETDIDLLKEPSAQMKLLSRSVYGDGSTVDRHLTSKVYSELSSYCQANGIHLQQYSRFRPAMLMTILTMLELKKMGITEEGVDAHYYALAKKDRKTVKWLETTDEQINYLVSSADGHEDEFVSYSLKDLQENREQLEMLTAAWRKGDGSKIDGIMVAEMKTAAPYIYKKLLLERNRNWLPTILAEQKPPKTLFILVGVAHLVGPDGLLESLKKSGYKVEKL